MLEGFYTAASGMMQQQRVLNATGNNITNMKTAGYKAERVTSTTFQQTYLTCLEDGRYAYVGTGDPTRLVKDVADIFDQSSLRETERPFDMAISGEGFFNILSGDIVYLTRNGAFDIDEEGYLVLPGSGRVQGAKGDIYLGGSDFTVTENGVILDKNNRAVDRLLITMPGMTTDEDGNQIADITKYSNGMYQLGNPAAAVEVTLPTVYQNALENSNIDINREYTLMIEAQRTFQSCSKALQMIDDINGKAASQIAAI